MIVKGILAIGARGRLHELEEYLKTTEKYLQKAKSELEAWLNEQAKNLPPRERDEFEQFYSDIYWDYALTFPRVLRNSFLVSAHSLLEHEMGRICETLKKEQQLPNSWQELGLGVLKNFKKYCKLASLPYQFNNLAWQEINNYYLVRNCITHNNGSIKGSKREQELRTYAVEKKITEESMIFPEVRPQDRIALTEQFCREVIKTMWAFLSKVFAAYESQKQKQKTDS